MLINCTLNIQYMKKVILYKEPLENSTCSLLNSRLFLIILFNLSLFYLFYDVKWWQNSVRTSGERVLQALNLNQALYLRLGLKQEL